MLLMQREGNLLPTFLFRLKVKMSRIWFAEGFAFLYEEEFVRRKMLGWHNSLMGKRKEKAWRTIPFMLNVDFMEGKQLKGVQ